MGGSSLVTIRMTEDLNAGSSPYLHSDAVRSQPVTGGITYQRSRVGSHPLRVQRAMQVCVYIALELGALAFGESLRPAGVDTMRGERD